MLRALRREPGFYRRLWVLALPIVLQNIITTSLGFADTFMVGLLGNAEMAAVTAANVPIFIIQAVIFLFFAAEQFLSKYRQKLVVKGAKEELAEKKAEGGQKGAEA